MLEAHRSTPAETSEDTPSESLYTKYIPKKQPKALALAAAVERERRTTRTRPLTLKNGQYMVVLLAGGGKDHAWSIRERLAKTRGLYVKYHVDPEHHHNQSCVPSDVDLVIILTDFIRHPEAKTVIDQAKALGVRWIRTVTKLSTLIQGLHNHGIHKADPLPDHLIAKMQFNEDLPTLKRTTPDPAPEVPVVEEVATPTALAPTPLPPELTPVDPTPLLNQIADEAMEPMDRASRRGLPSPRLAAIAAALNAICAEEGVTVLLDGKQMQITAA